MKLLALVPDPILQPKLHSEEQNKTIDAEL